MDYYLVIPNEEPIPMGTQSFSFFYAEQGFDMLVDMVDKKPNLIEFIKIIKSDGTTISVEQFLNMFDGDDQLQMRRRS